MRAIQSLLVGGNMKEKYNINIKNNITLIAIIILVLLVLLLAFTHHVFTSVILLGIFCIFLGIYILKMKKYFLIKARSRLFDCIFLFILGFLIIVFAFLSFYLSDIPLMYS